MGYWGPWVQPDDTWSTWIPVAARSSTYRRSRTDVTGATINPSGAVFDSLAIDFLAAEFGASLGTTYRYTTAQLVLAIDLYSAYLSAVFPTTGSDVDDVEIEGPGHPVGPVQLQLKPAFTLSGSPTPGVFGWTLRRITDVSDIALYSPWTSKLCWCGAPIRGTSIDDANASWIPGVSSLPEIEHWSDSQSGDERDLTIPLSDFLTTTEHTDDGGGDATGVWAAVCVADWMLGSTPPGPAQSGTISFMSEAYGGAGWPDGDGQWRLWYRPPRYRLHYTTAPLNFDAVAQTRARGKLIIPLHIPKPGPAIDALPPAPAAPDWYRVLGGEYAGSWMRLFRATTTRPLSEGVDFWQRPTSFLINRLDGTGMYLDIDLYVGPPGDPTHDGYGDDPTQPWDHDDRINMYAATYPDGTPAGVVSIDGDQPAGTDVWLVCQQWPVGADTDPPLNWDPRTDMGEWTTGPTGPPAAFPWDLAAMTEIPLPVPADLWGP